MNGTQTPRDLFRKRGERTDEIGTVAKGDQGEFVALDRSREELLDGGARFLDAVAHATTGVEDQARRERCIRPRERDNLLFRLILQKPECILRKSEKGTVALIRYHYRD